MKIEFNIKKSLFNDYDTVLFDLDLTILNGLNTKGESIPAMALEPPLNLVDENTVKDSKGNIAKLQEGVRDVLENLDEYGLNLGVVSASALPDLADEAQPAIMILKKLDIYRFFNYIVVVKPKINKGDYARPDGKTLFIDDDSNQLQAVNTRGLVDVLNRHSFANWNDLFSDSKEAKPKPTSLQTAVNAPQPTTSSWAQRFRQLFSFKHQADPLTYTDKSDIDEGIGGSTKNKADMWHMEDHLVLDNGRDHIWGEPWEPIRQYFLDETTAPTLEDKIKQQHPDKGGIANSSLKFADVEDNTQTNPVYDEESKALIREIADTLVYDYVQHHELDAEDAVTILLPTLKQYLTQQYGTPADDLAHYEPIMVEEITEAAKFHLNMGVAYEEEEPQWSEEDKSALATTIQEFLVSKFGHEQFPLATLVRMVEQYGHLSYVPPEILTDIIKSLPTRYPHLFLWNGSNISIGLPIQNAPKIELNVDELKDIALKPIEEFTQFGSEVKKTPDGIYIFKDNGSNVLAVAHLDTVQDMTHFDVQTTDESRVIRNAQLDDRLGAYIILKLLPELGISTDILLTEGEETGRSTAKYFESKKQYNWVFSFDRMGMDTVMYQYHDKPTEELLNKEDFTVGQGSFSDIAFLEHLGVKGFNFGVGYYDNHGDQAHAIESHVLHNITKFKNFYDMYKNKQLVHTDTGYTKRRFGSLRFDDGVTAQDGTWYPVKFSDNPKAESYPDYMGDTDVSPLDPKTREDKDRPDSIRTDMQKMYYGWGTHDTVMRPETDRPITPFAGLRLGTDIHGEEVFQYLTDEEKEDLHSAYSFFTAAASDPDDPRTTEQHAQTAVDMFLKMHPSLYPQEYDFIKYIIDMYGYPTLGALASLNFEQPITLELHKPNAIMTHEAVADALTFAETVKPRAILRHEVRDDFKYQAPVKTAEYANTPDATNNGRQLSIDAALSLLDKWYTTSQQLMSGARDMRNKAALIFENQFNREAVEARLGLGGRESVEGNDVHEKYQALRQRLLAIQSGQVPDPLTIN